MNQKRLLIGASVLVVVVALTAATERLVVEGDSMTPVLQPGDRLLAVRRLSPRRGDIVIAADPRDPGRRIVKRVAAVGPQGAGIVLAGDNPDRSTDSRHFGPVSRVAVRSRVVYRYGPEDRQGRLPGLATSSAQG